MASGNHKKNVSLLVSDVEDEGSFFLSSSGHSDAKFGWKPTEPLTLQEAKQYFLDIMSAEVLHTTALPNSTIEEVYFSNGVTTGESADALRKRVGIAYGHAYFICPTIEFAEALYRSAPGTVQVYQWYYTAKMGSPKFCPTWAGACHSEDMYPMFGMALQKPNDYLPREREISEEVISAVKAFIRDG